MQDLWVSWSDNSSGLYLGTGLLNLRFDMGYPDRSFLGFPKCWDSTWLGYDPFRIISSSSFANHILIRRDADNAIWRNAMGESMLTRKIKLKLSLGLIKHHAMKMREGEEL
jgi:hypothetical protein